MCLLGEPVQGFCYYAKQSKVERLTPYILSLKKPPEARSQGALLAQIQLPRNTTRVLVKRSLGCKLVQGLLLLCMAIKAASYIQIQIL